jgi:hypothetical protein
MSAVPRRSHWRTLKCPDERQAKRGEGRVRVRLAFTAVPVEPARLLGSPALTPADVKQLIRRDAAGGDGGRVSADVATVLRP